MTSNGSTLTKCPPESTGLLLSEIFKDPPIVTYNGWESRRPVTLLLSLGNSDDRDRKGTEFSYLNFGPNYMSRAGVSLPGSWHVC